jgi:RHS repeat-associated protein
LADEQVTSSETAVNVIWPLADQQGTIRDLAIHSSITHQTTVANHRNYDSFGNLISQTDRAIDELFGFTGRQIDAATGLQYNLNRWYDPKTGRWISEDPIGFAGRDTNLQRYVGNNPLNFVDPSGLAGWGSAGKLIVDRLTKQGIKRTWYQIHHIVGREIFDQPKYGKWLARIGIEKNCSKNLMALPKALGKKKSFMPGAATHNGRTIKEYVEQVSGRLDKIMASHNAKKISDLEAKKLVEGLQDELKIGLENGTIALSRDEHDTLLKGSVISIAGLFYLGAAETATAQDSTEPADGVTPCEVAWSFVPYSIVSDAIAAFGTWLYNSGYEGIYGEEGQRIQENIRNRFHP